MAVQSESMSKMKAEQIEQPTFLVPTNLTIAFLLACAHLNRNWDVQYDYEAMNTEKGERVPTRFEGISDPPNEELFGQLLLAASRIAEEHAKEDGSPDNTALMGKVNAAHRTIKPWDEYDPYWDRRLPVSDTSW